jgi:PAS domain S-box-containing protein
MTARTANGHRPPWSKRLDQQPSDLHDSEYFRDIADTLSVVLALTNADLTQFLFVNRAHEEVCGQTVESLYANSFSFIDAVHPEDQPALRKAIKGLIEGTPIDGIECRLVQPDGSARWVLCRGCPVRNASNLTLAGSWSKAFAKSRAGSSTSLRKHPKFYSLARPTRRKCPRVPTPFLPPPFVLRRARRGWRTKRSLPFSRWPSAPWRRTAPTSCPSSACIPPRPWFATPCGRAFAEIRVPVRSFGVQFCLTAVHEESHT